MYMNIKEFRLLSFSILLLAGCASQQPQQEESSMNLTQLEESLVNMDIPIDLELSQQEPEDEYKVKGAPTSKKQESRIELPPNEHPWIGKMVCKNNVKVKYRMPDENGYNAFFRSVIQVQGVVKDVLESDQKLKVVVTGWYSTDKTLQGWRPYLKHPPLSEDFVIRKDTQVIESKSKWERCEFFEKEKK